MLLKLIDLTSCFKRKKKIWYKTSDALPLTQSFRQSATSLYSSIRKSECCVLMRWKITGPVDVLPRPSARWWAEQKKSSSSSPSLIKKKKWCLYTADLSGCIEEKPTQEGAMTRWKKKERRKVRRIPPFFHLLRPHFCGCASITQLWNVLSIPWAIRGSSLKPIVIDFPLFHTPHQHVTLLLTGAASLL